MKKFIVSLSILSCFLFADTTKAQVEKPTELNDYDMSSIGLGIGIDYGGFGINGQYYINEKVTPFIGLGYNIVGLGYNVGLKYRFLNKESTKRYIPFLVAMYGYNAALKVDNLDNNGYYSPGSTYQKIFYGPSIGFGIDKKRYKYNKGYWSFELLVPMRLSDYQNTMDNLNRQGVTFSSKPLPIAISLGYKFIID